MNNVNVMVVEDEGIVSIDIRNILTRLGYTVSSVAFSGEEAIRKSRQSPPDIVLMDIGLKGDLDGIDTAARLKRERDIPVVFLTGFADDNTLARAREIKPAGYIVKPINEDELAETVAGALS